MKKVFSITLLVLLLGGLISAQENSSATAIAGGDARGASLGGNPNNPFLMDYNDVFTNPAYSLKYTDLLYVEAGNTFAPYRAKNQSIGWTMGMNDVAFGISIGHREGPMFAENSYGLGNVLFADADYMSFPTTEPQAPIQLYFGMKMGGMALGLSLYRSGFSQLNDGAGTDPLGSVIGAKKKSDFSDGQTGLKLGVLMGENTNLMIDGSVLFRINSVSYDFTDADTGAALKALSISATGIEIGVQGRAFYKMSDKLTLVPLVRFYTFGYEPEYTSTPAANPANTKPNKYGRTEIEVGVGANTKISSSTVSVGVSFQSIVLTNDATNLVGSVLNTTKQSQSMTDLPKVNIGAEIPFNSWLTGRIGYFRRFTTTTVTVEAPSPVAKTEVSMSSQTAYNPNLGRTAAEQELSFGLGLNFGGLSLNGYLADQFLADGPFIISGKARDLFGVLSLSFKF